MFWDLPPDGKCEWATLRNFVGQYNMIRGTTYTRSRCLDIEERNQSQPELLLESPSDEPMVVERKILVWPPDFFKYRRTEHDVFNQLQAQVQPHFQDNLYA